MSRHRCASRGRATPRGNPDRARRWFHRGGPGCNGQRLDAACGQGECGMAYASDAAGMSPRRCATAPEVATLGAPGSCPFSGSRNRGILCRTLNFVARPGRDCEGTSIRGPDHSCNGKPLERRRLVVTVRQYDPQRLAYPRGRVQSCDQRQPAGRRPRGAQRRDCPGLADSTIAAGPIVMMHPKTKLEELRRVTTARYYAHIERQHGGSPTWL